MGGEPGGKSTVAHGDAEEADCTKLSAEKLSSDD